MRKYTQHSVWHGVQALFGLIALGPFLGNPSDTHLKLGFSLCSAAYADGLENGSDLSSRTHRRRWDPAWAETFRRARVGEAARFELMDNEFASGVISFLECTNGELVYVSGKVTAPRPGRFFFVKNPPGGLAGEASGFVEFDDTDNLYCLEPTGPGGAIELVERPSGSVLCKLPRPAGFPREHEPKVAPVIPGGTNDPTIPPYQNGIVPLQSLRGALAVIYLDFQGGYTPRWKTEGVYYARPAVNNDQIRDVWQRVAGDFAPFKINVTTDLKVFEDAAPGSRQRVIITPTTFFGPGYLGVAHQNSFNWPTDYPCWAFIVAGKCCADICSHEAGHTLGLSHKGVVQNGVYSEYYWGQGSGETSWGPLMGQPYAKNVTQWSKGEYLGANNFEDELWIIANRNNNVAFREDDTGGALPESRYLELYPDFSAGAEGIIETTAETDAYQFTTAGGEVSLRADPTSFRPDLALSVALYDVFDNLVVDDSPLDVLGASLTANLSAGSYTFRVCGAGRGDPLTDGFSAYGSVGCYLVTGYVANARLPNRFSIIEHSTNGTSVGLVSPLLTNGHPHQYMIVAGNKGHTFAIDNLGALVVSEEGLLDYARLLQGSPSRVQFELFVDILDTIDASLSEFSRRIVVSVSPELPAPLLARPQWLGSPVLLADGSVIITSQYADGQSVATEDLARFEAQVSENMKDWETLPTSLSCSNGFLVLIDSDAPNHPARFYRIVERNLE